MNIPFTAEQFFNVFAQYNNTIWPMQFVLNLLGLAALFFAIWKAKYTNRIVSAILAFLWLWTGIVYHITFFSSINKPAYVFGSLVILQGILFFATGTVYQKISFKPQLDAYSIVGGILLLYGLLIYPILGYFLGHIYPYSPTFGAPCPTTIFTFGLLLWTDGKFPKYLLAIPVIWSLIGFSAAFQWGVMEDIMLLISALVASVMIFYRGKGKKQLTSSFST